MQLPVKQRNCGLPTEETGKASRCRGSRPTGSGSGKFGTVIPVVTPAAGRRRAASRPGAPSGRASAASGCGRRGYRRLPQAKGGFPNRSHSLSFSVLLPRVKATMRRLEIGNRHSCINLRGLDRGMPEHFLQMPDRRARAQHVRRAAMSKRMGRDRPINVGCPAVLVYDVPDGVGPMPRPKRFKNRCRSRSAPSQSSRTPTIYVCSSAQTEAPMGTARSLRFLPSRTIRKPCSVSTSSKRRCAVSSRRMALEYNTSRITRSR